MNIAVEGMAETMGIMVEKERCPAACFPGLVSGLAEGHLKTSTGILIMQSMAGLSCEE